MHSSGLFTPVLALALFAGGACGGRGLAALMRQIAKEGGYPSSRYYALGGGGWAALPVLGHFLAPRGHRCRRLVLLEIAGGLACAACWVLFPPAQAVCGMIFLFALLGAGCIDLDHMVIPDLFTIGLAALGVGLSAFVPALHGEGGLSVWHGARSLAASGLGVMVGSAIPLWFSLFGETVLDKEVLGFGDVKFLGAIGAFCGWQGAVCAIFGGALLAAGAMICLHVRRSVSGNPSVQLFSPGSASGQAGQLNANGHFPFGPMLAVAAAGYFLGAHGAADAFLAQYRALF